MLVKCEECGWEGPEKQCCRGYGGFRNLPLLVCPQCGSRDMQDVSEEVAGDAAE